MAISDARPGLSPDTGGPAASDLLIERSFLKNVWYIAGWAVEFEAGRPHARRIVGLPLVLYRRAGGALVALADRCAHRWAPLSLGRLEGDDLRCMYHGVKFGPHGRCVEVPDQDTIPDTLRVATYPVIERHRFVWVWPGDPAAADPDLIPDLGALDRPGFRVQFGSLDYRANYALINDNLLDLSHVKFNHEKTFGRLPQSISGANAKPIERGVRTEGWSGADEMGEGLQALNADGAAAGNEIWGRIDYTVPGIYHAATTQFPAGTARRCDGQAPGSELQPIMESFSIQAVTPIDLHATRYFFSGVMPSDVMAADQADAYWQNVVLKAFDEDLVMIEAQQKMIDTTPGVRLGGVAADRGPTLFRKLMRRLMESDPA